MKEPRNLDQYVTAEKAANFLRFFAAKIEREAERYPLKRLVLSEYNWNPEWKTKTTKPKRDTHDAPKS